MRSVDLSGQVDNEHGHWLQVDLEGLLAQRGLPKRGNKAALVERLWGAMQQGTGDTQPGGAATAKSDTSTANTDAAAPVDSQQPETPPVQDDVDEDMIIRSGRRNRASRCGFQQACSRRRHGCTASGEPVDLPVNGHT